MQNKFLERQKLYGNVEHKDNKTSVIDTDISNS